MRIAMTGALLASLLANAANGQRLYRKDMDAAAQAAVKAMEKVDSKDLFNRMLDNLSTQSKQDFETTFSGIQRLTRDKIQGWDSWCAVHSDLVLVMNRLGYPGLKPQIIVTATDETDLRNKCTQLLIKDDPGGADAKSISDGWKKALDEIKAQKTEVDSELAKLKGSPQPIDPPLLSLFAQLGDLAEIQSALDQFAMFSEGAKLKTFTNPVSEATGILKRLGAAYHDYRDRVDQINKVKQELRDLQAEMLKIALQKLVAEEQHLQRLMAIETRRAQELEDATASFEQYRFEVLCERTRNPGLDLKRIDESLRELGQAVASDTSPPGSAYLYSAKELTVLGDEQKHLQFCATETESPRMRIEALSRALFQAAAVQDRGATPALFAELRRAQEQQRYSIVVSSLEARAYETLVNTGVRRLALLHAGGIKPEQIAQLIYQAGQLTGVSVIAAKQ